MKVIRPRGRGCLETLISSLYNSENYQETEEPQQIGLRMQKQVV